MAQAAIYDTHNTIKQFVKAGLTEKQAELFERGCRNLVEAQLAASTDSALITQNIETLRKETKHDSALIHKDIENIRKEVEALRKETKHDSALIHKDIENIRKEIETLRKDTTTQIETLRKDTTTQIETLRKETTTQIAALRQETKHDNALVRSDMKVMEKTIIFRLGGLMVALFAILGGFIGVLKYMN